MDYTFKAEEKEILECYLEADLFKEEKTFKYLNTFYKSPGALQPSLDLQRGIELIIRPQCNQKCEYCYITRYGTDLYPLHTRISNEEICNRIDKILDWVFNTKGTFINRWELFAGDLFYDDLAFDIFDVFYNRILEIYNKWRRVVSMPENGGLILIPCNFSFIDDDEKTKKVKEYIAKFKELNWDLGFSISTDGESCVDTREQRELATDHFDKLFQWTLEYPANGFHAIVSASNVGQMIESYDWWKNKFQHWYGDKPELDIDFLPYWLEARNDDWTEQTIQEYLKLLDYMWDDRLAMCDNNIDHLAYHLFKGDGANNTLRGLRSNDLINLKVEEHPEDSQITQCTLSHCACINLNTYEIVPCHRLSYPQFVGFKLVEQDGKIVDIEPKNISGYLTTVMHNEQARPKCCACIYRRLCHKGCLGAQYESHGELFQPVISVCQLIMRYTAHMVNKYHTSGVLRSAYKQDLLSPNQMMIYGEILVQELGYSEEEIYNG